MLHWNGIRLVARAFDYSCIGFELRLLTICVGLCWIYISFVLLLWRQELLRFCSLCLPSFLTTSFPLAHGLAEVLG